MDRLTYHQLFAIIANMTDEQKNLPIDIVDNETNDYYLARKMGIHPEFYSSDFNYPVIVVSNTKVEK